MIVLGIDPGPEQSAWCEYDSAEKVLRKSGIERNEHVWSLVRFPSEMGVDTTQTDSAFVIEMVQSYGMPVGKTVFETCVWIGIFLEAAGLLQQKRCFFDHVARVTRPECALHLCGTHRAKDGSMNQALKDKLGGKGTKKDPGPLYGVRSHIWSALAVAVTWVETQGDRGRIPEKEMQPCES